ncbi:hypothetical protein FJZ31_15935 [Candidatus Poribacteria bacterium]|nr:hypothetical protein [Candidatus Poribacteria bacterium]
MLMTHKEIEKHIGEIFPFLGKKHHLDEDKTMALMQDLTSALAKAAEEKEYQTILQYVDTAFKLLKKHCSTFTYSIYFDTFANAVWKLAAETEGQPIFRRYLTAAFAAAVRRAEAMQEPLTETHFSALELSLNKLMQPEVSDETMDECTCALQEAGLDPMISLGERAKAFVASIIAEEEDERIF